MRFEKKIDEIEEEEEQEEEAEDEEEVSQADGKNQRGEYETKRKFTAKSTLR